MIDRIAIKEIAPIRIATVKSVHVVNPKCLKNLGGFTFILPQISPKSSQSVDRESLQVQKPSLHSIFVMLLDRKLILAMVQF